MSGDTRLKQTPQGWVDLDNPTTTYPSRRLARLGRRRNRSGSTPVATPTATATATTQALSQTSQALTIQPQPDSPDSALTSLQVRLLDRMTQWQGVDLVDALSVITSNGYNAAASYGHMREAGATHDEAVEVISKGSADISLAYGLARAAGYNHDYSLQRAER